MLQPQHYFEKSKDLGMLSRLKMLKKKRGWEGGDKENNDKRKELIIYNWPLLWSYLSKVSGMTKGKNQLVSYGRRSDCSKIINNVHLKRTEGT